MKKFTILSAITVSVFILGFSIYSALSNIESTPTPTPFQTIPSITPNQMVGADEDEHGCKGSTGYSWCEEKQKCLRVWEEPCIKVSPTPDNQAIEQLKKAFAAKYNKKISEVYLTINNNSGEHISGSVKFGIDVPGGWFLAYKKVGVWNIAADGNGNIFCENIEGLNFPTDMVPECYSQKENKLIIR